jgi:hypothetical protein
MRATVSGWASPSGWMAVDALAANGSSCGAGASSAEVAGAGGSVMAAAGATLCMIIPRQSARETNRFHLLV